ncbi:hypothetical protein MTO96_006099 [Rhipicephalus appendiculatus]
MENHLRRYGRITAFQSETQFGPHPPRGVVVVGGGWPRVAPRCRCHDFTFAPAVAGGGAPRVCRPFSDLATSTLRSHGADPRKSSAPSLLSPWGALREAGAPLRKAAVRQG